MSSAYGPVVALSCIAGAPTIAAPRRKVTGAEQVIVIVGIAKYPLLAQTREKKHDGGGSYAKRSPAGFASPTLPATDTPISVVVGIAPAGFAIVVPSQSVVERQNTRVSDPNDVAEAPATKPVPVIRTTVPPPIGP